MVADRRIVEASRFSAQGLFLCWELTRIMATAHIIRTKIAAPRKPARLLARRRINQAIGDAFFYRLTILQAGAGYGKSTALTGLVDEDRDVIWYYVTKEDSDPLVFLLHLCYAMQQALPHLRGIPTPLLETWDGSRGPLPSSEVLQQFLNALCEGLIAPALLVLEDTHLALETTEFPHILDRLIDLAPRDFHILLSSRAVPKLPNLSRWRSSGEVLDLDQSLLTFTTIEITDLFVKCYGYEITHEEAQRLSAETEGWAIALQMIWQSLRSGAAASIEDALNRQARSSGGLFEVLANEVLAQQPRDVQNFLWASATLRVMTARACDAIMGTNDSAAMLNYLRRQELFIVDHGTEGLRYQYIFHQFLIQGSNEEQRQVWHRRAAEYYRNLGDSDSAIYHLLKAGEYLGAADFLEAYAGELLSRGRLDTLASYLEILPPETFYQRPAMLSYLGDLARLHSRFGEALGWYQQAEKIWRERGHRMWAVLRSGVYLIPSTQRAEELLQHALRLSDGIVDRESQAHLVELLAENRLNAGKPEEAERLRQQAETLRMEGPTDSQLIFRVLLRTGRLEQARRELEARIEAERIDPIQVPRLHRETLFLLSLIYAFQGEVEAAYRTAVEGTLRGVELDSPFMKAVGHMRQGHALMLHSDSDHYTQAREQFQQAVEISHTIAIPRLRVEALWGLCRAYGYQGDLVKALQAAEEGVEIATGAGDEWIASLVRLAYGAGLTLADRFESSETWLSQAANGFLECSDPFGTAATRLWLCFGAFRQNDRERLRLLFPDLLAISHQHGYDYLFTRPTLLGVPDEHILVPLLIHAREQGWESSYIDQLLLRMGLPQITCHPGYQLRVFTLGTFQVLLGHQAIPPNGWRREKTRQLFQLLLTYRDAPLDSEQIYEHLWRDEDPAVAARNFKVVLNTLFNVLEPQRSPGSDSAFILREGSVYSIRPGTDIWLDSATFESNLRKAETAADEQPDEEISVIEEAVRLYRGEYLPDARYENWAAIEREHLAVKFLQAADRLCELYLQRGLLDETIDLCQRILAQDNCWERAYRHLMMAYHYAGDRGQIARTYQRCKQALRDDLDVVPSPQTERLYQDLISQS
jgi:ATP/maltotriose-dependent transcriptional regulator MalT/DNA-binding SARP family transcriptional activator